MKFKCKMMFLGCQKYTSKKNNQSYNVLGLMDLDTSTTYKIFIDDNKAIKILNEQKLYNNYEYELYISKNEKNGLINLGVV